MKDDCMSLDELKDYMDRLKYYLSEYEAATEFEHLSVKELKELRDELDYLLDDVEKTPSVNKEEFRQRLEDAIEDINSWISTLQTDEENWTLGI